MPPDKNDACLTADIFFHRGEAHRLGSQFSKALACYKKSATLYNKIHHAHGLINSQLGMAACLRHTEDFPAAIHIYQQVLRYPLTSILSPGGERKKDKNPLAPSGERVRVRGTILADALCGLGLALKGAGRLTEALDSLQQSLTLYTKIKDRQGIGHNRWALGVVYRTAGRLTEARKELEQAVASYDELGDKGGWAYAACALGGTLRVSGLAEASFDLYRESYNTFKKINDPYGTAYGLCGMASAERVQGKTKSALNKYKDAEKLYLKLNQKTPYAFTLWGKAGVERIQGKLKAAAELYKRSKAVFHDVKDERGEIYADLGLGFTLIQKGKTTKANNLFKTILPKAEHLGLPLEACHAQLGLLRTLANRSGGLMDALAERYRSLGALPDVLINRYQDLP